MVFWYFAWEFDSCEFNQNRGARRKLSKNRVRVLPFTKSRPRYGVQLRECTPSARVT